MGKFLCNLICACSNDTHEFLYSIIIYVVALHHAKIENICLKQLKYLFLTVKMYTEFYYSETSL